MPNFRLTNLSGTTMTFVDPTDYRSGAKLSWSVQPKQQHGVSGAALQNAKWTLTDHAVLRAPAPSGADCTVTSGTENIRISTEVSGSVENKDKIIERLTLHAHNVLLLAETLASGFPPEIGVELPTALALGEG